MLSFTLCIKIKTDGGQMSALCLLDLTAAFDTVDSFHAFVSSRVDYCNAVFAGAPKTITDRLQRVLNAVARVVSDTRKFDRGLSRIMHTELHRLDVPERINYKRGMLMYRCQHNKAPRYLMDHCTSVSDVAYRQRLRSASSHEVSVPRHRLSTYGHRAFAIAGPTVWNSLP